MTPSELFDRLDNLPLWGEFVIVGVIAVLALLGTILVMAGFGG